jgi:hypothetical protein
MFEIVYVAQVREQIPHRDYDGIGATLAFFPVGYADTMVYHVMDITPVFRQNHSL